MWDKEKTLEAIIEKIEVLDKMGKEKIAAFDLDNTLLIGDIGDAVFAQLLLEKRDLSLTWRQYQDLVQAGKKFEAYTRVVTAMAGISVPDLEKTTARVLTGGKSQLQIEGDQVPVPHANPLMKDLLEILHSRGYRVVVISATNVYSVRQVAKELFNLTAENVFGIQPVVEMGESKRGEQGVLVLKDRLEEPITVVEGKAELYREKISSHPPLITGGDSMSDVPMLNLTDPEGLVIWVDKGGAGAKEIKEKLLYPGNLFVVSP